MNEIYAGFDIGGTKCASIIAEADFSKNHCKIIDKTTFETDPLSWKSNVNKLINNLEKLKTKHKVTLKTLGISCGGPLNSKTGHILSPPNLPLWDNVPIKEICENKLKIPTFLQNDANAGAIAEGYFGSGIGCSDFLFLTFGTGLGAGIFLNNQLYEGSNGLAGEIGHIRLEKTGPIGYNKEGSFEGFCSGGGIRQLGLKMIKEDQSNSILHQLSEDEINAKTIAIAAEQKYDELAKKIYYESGKYLGKGLSIIIDILNPKRIILGGIYSRSEDLLKNSMEKQLKKETLKYSLENCEIKKASLKNSIGDYAAIAVAVEGEKSGK